MDLSGACQTKDMIIYFKGTLRDILGINLRGQEISLLYYRER